MGTGGVVPQEERLVGLCRTIDEIDGSPDQLVVDVFHIELGFGIHVRMRRQRAAIDNRLFANLAPTRIGRWIVDGGGLGLDDVARAEIGEELRRFRILRIVGLFHRVEMVKDTIELVEAMHRGQILVAIAKMIFADLRRGVAVRLEKLGDGRVLVLQALLGGRHADFQQTGTEWGLPEDESGTTGGAGLLSVIIGEQRAFFGDAIDVGCAAAHHAAVVGADIPDANVIGHDHDNVRLLGSRLR